jgi:hypothetical protein
VTRVNLSANSDLFICVIITINFSFYPSIKFFSSLIFSLFIIVFLASPLPAQRTEPKIHGTFDGDPIYTVLPVGAIPAITQPQFLSGDKASAQMSPDEPVIGIIVNGDVRAYSTWHLDAHEIVNDTIGGTPLAVTW